MGIYCEDKDINKLVTQLVKEGWYVVVAKHTKLYTPRRKILVSISKSPSCSHAYRNVLGDINRARREDEKET